MCPGTAGGEGVRTDPAALSGIFATSHDEDEVIEYSRRSLRLVAWTTVVAGAVVGGAVLASGSCTRGLAAVMVGAGLGAGVLWLGPLRRSAERRPVAAGVSLLTLDFAGAGMALGAFGSSTALGFLYAGCATQVLFGLGPARRLLLGLWLNAVSVGALLWAAPALLGAPHVPAMVSFYVGLTVFVGVIGQLGLRMRSVTAQQRRELAARGEALAELAARLRARVAEQRTELRRLTDHLRALRVREQRRVSAQLREQLDPELAELGRALDRVRSRSGATPRSLGAAPAAMARVRAVFRRLLHQLRPPVVETLGLEGALRWLAEDAEARRRPPLRLAIALEGPGLAAEVAAGALAVAWEAVERAVDEGPPSRWSLAATREAEGLRLRFEDDVPPREAPSVPLVAIRERVAALGGAAEIASGPGGVRIEVHIPLVRSAPPPPAAPAGRPEPAEAVGADTAWWLGARELPPAERRAWQAHVVPLMGTWFARFALFLAGIFALWWPLDLVVFDDAAAVRGMAWFRVVAIGGGLIFALAPAPRAALVARPVEVSVAALCAALVLSAWLMGGFAGLETGWGHYLSAPSVMMVGYGVSLPARLGIGLAFDLASFGGYLLARPEALDSPLLGEALISALVLLALFGALGHALSRLVRTDFVQRRALNRREAELQTLSATQEQQVAEQTEQLRGLALELQRRREAEREWLAHEVHDALGQEIGALGYQLVYARRVLELGAEATDPVDGCVRILGRTRGTVSRLLEHLMPEALGTLGLPGALEALVRRQTPEGGLRLELEMDLGDTGADTPVAIACYRIVQEALTNVVKHARAQTARVCVTRRADRLDVVVSDDGVGLDPGRIGHGLGLEGMRRRADVLGGSVELRPRSGGGAELLATLPIREVRA